MDYGDSPSTKKALQWYQLFMNLDPGNVWIEERFEAQMRISLILMRLPNAKENIDRIITEMDKAISIFSDRAEPYYKLGVYLCGTGHHELAYKYLSKGKTISLANALEKYQLFVLTQCYEMHFVDWLSVACYWTGRIKEGKAMLESGLKDKSQSYNHEHFKKNIEKLNKLQKTGA
jgi:tetratricopeptide (TPR) repeat protein